MAALLIGAELAGILGALFGVPIAALANVFLGALYRARRGEDTPLSASPSGQVHAEALPRLSQEISEVTEEGPIEDKPVPHTAGERVLVGPDAADDGVGGRVDQGDVRDRPGVRPDGDGARRDGGRLVASLQGFDADRGPPAGGEAYHT